MAAVVPISATYDPFSGELIVVFDGALTESEDISTDQWSAVLPGGRVGVFSAAGLSKSTSVTFVLAEGPAAGGDTRVRYGARQWTRPSGSRAAKCRAAAARTRASDPIE